MFHIIRGTGLSTSNVLCRRIEGCTNRVEHLSQPPSYVHYSWEEENHRLQDFIEIGLPSGETSDVGVLLSNMLFKGSIVHERRWSSFLLRRKDVFLFQDCDLWCNDIEELSRGDVDLRALEKIWWHFELRVCEFKVMFRVLKKSDIPSNHRFQVIIIICNRKKGENCQKRSPSRMRLTFASSSGCFAIPVDKSDLQHHSQDYTHQGRSLRVIVGRLWHDQGREGRAEALFACSRNLGNIIRGRYYWMGLEIRNFGEPSIKLTNEIHYESTEADQESNKLCTNLRGINSRASTSPKGAESKNWERHVDRLCLTGCFYAWETNSSYLSLKILLNTLQRSDGICQHSQSRTRSEENSAAKSLQHQLRGHD